MRKLILHASCVLAVLGALHDAPSAAATRVPTDPNNLSCTLGPLPKTFGKSHWLVYACGDGRSIVVVSAPGSPASPFQFFFFWGADGFEIHGEGTGKKEATSAAFEELKLLSEAQIAVLFADAKAIGPSRQGET
jgi:hypothetical protein